MLTFRTASSLVGVVLVASLGGCGGGSEDQGSPTGSGGGGASQGGGGAGEGGTEGVGGMGGVGGSGGAGGAGGSGDVGGAGGAGGSGGTGGSTPLLCGNGMLDAGELCDPAIATGEPGACPVACDDGDACTVDSLAGADCDVHCATMPVPAMDGDGCCPAGQMVGTDGDCEPLYPLGSAVTVCTGAFQAPSLAATGAGFAVGCTPDGNQNVTPQVKIVDGAGALIAAHTLLTSDGYYYTPIQLTGHDGRYQALYQYNCDDNGSWQVGWGWGCIDFREYDPMTGALVSPSLVFGETGHNGHPVLDWSGTEFGVGWVSYDDVYFRRLDANRQLVGGGRLDNILVGADPLNSDARDSARTEILWDGSGYGIFSVMGYRLYFARVNAMGAVVTPLVDIGSAYTQTFRGQLSAVYQNGAYFVAHLSGGSGTGVSFLKVSLTGSVLASTVVTTTGADRTVDVHAMGGLFYLVTQDGAGNAVMTVLDEAAAVVPGMSGVLGDTPMRYPAVARDPVSGDVGVAYLSSGWGGAVSFQRFRQGP
ncbi:hypothetical protein [Chondromyces apiculatus]|uniref:Erythrocyte membrane protein 1 (PfEMP1) n=1 Tax=Chondromyces apiculatus DSM 436 TaxID=1192034 RepID=A0A017T563_9BACT|nr:hypothetical protein [Chondromyces apiculatus]EYF04122.1 erythrocyte membrane protein 1 (PfEMP1) [Chondromyces apiculatus DSM 436]